MSIDVSRKRRYAAAAFCTLLLLSVLWPSPVVEINRHWVEEEIEVDELSFLGREAPSWDVVFWCVAGLFALVILQSADAAADPREPLRQLRAIRFERWMLRRAALAMLAGIALTAAVWPLADAAVLAWAEGIQSDATETFARLLNRLGGGMNPVLLVAFFLIAGVAYVERRWVAIAIAMGMSGLAAGLLAQIVKHLVGRARPELWLGPAHYTASSTSFPSGHTVGAFALAGVLVFASRSAVLRLVAFSLASGVALSRVLAFRHWASDVTASAVIGVVMAWLATAALVRRVE